MRARACVVGPFLRFPVGEASAVVSAGAYFLRGREIPYWFSRATKAVRPMPSSLAAVVWLPAVFASASRIRCFSSGSAAGPGLGGGQAQRAGSGRRARLGFGPVAAKVASISSRGRWSGVMTSARSAQQHGPVDDIAQLADVARPGVAAQEREGVGRNCGSPPTQLAGHLAGEASRKRLDLRRGARAAGGISRVMPLSRKYRSLRNPPASMACCRLRLVAETNLTSTARLVTPPTRIKRAGLDHAQQLGLQGRGQLADLVEKHGAARCGLEQPRLGLRGAR